MYVSKHDSFLLHSTQNVKRANKIRQHNRISSHLRKKEMTTKHNENKIIFVSLTDLDSYKTFTYNMCNGISRFWTPCIIC